MIRDNKIRIKYKKPEILRGAVSECRQGRSIHCCPIENDVRLIRMGSMGSYPTRIHLSSVSSLSSTCTVTGSYVTIRNIEFNSVSHATGAAIGIYVSGGSYTNIIDCVLGSDYDYGINITESGKAVHHHLRNIRSNGATVGIHINANYCTVIGCDAYASETCINIEGSYNLVSDNYVYPSSSWTSSQHSIKISLSAAYNMVCNNMMPGKNYTSNGVSTNTFSNNKYQ